MDEQECKSDLEQLTNSLFSDFWALHASERTYRAVGQWSIYLKGKYEVCLNSRGSEITYIILVQISKETSKLDAKPSRSDCDVDVRGRRKGENSRLHPVQNEQLKLKGEQKRHACFIMCIIG